MTTVTLVFCNLDHSLEDNTGGENEDLYGSLNSLYGTAEDRRKSHGTLLLLPIIQVDLKGPWNRFFQAN